jgi:hypothetical protein
VFVRPLFIFVTPKRKNESDDEFNVNQKNLQVTSKKRKQKGEEKEVANGVLMKEKIQAKSQTGPPLKAKTAGKDLIIDNILNNASYLSNLNVAAMHFEQKGKIHRLVDLSGKPVSVLMVGTLSSVNLGKYGTFNMEYERSLERARLSFHLQGMPGWESEHEKLVKKINELEQKQFGVGKLFTAEDKQLALKPGDRILLKRKIWRMADEVVQMPIIDDPGLTLWADMIASKKVPNYFQLGAYDYNGTDIYTCEHSNVCYI